MPKEGYTSLTIGDAVYDSWHEFYESRKNNFRKQGINSLSGLISGILYHVMKQDGSWLTEVIFTPEDGISARQ